MTNIFVSYRRDDSHDVSGRIHDRLTSHFTKAQVFKDVDSIPIGFDFRQVLTERVAACDVLLAVIGKDWLSIAGPTGTRRLDDPADFVRIEIEAALSRKIPVIPVLVGKASMPRAEDLPESLRELAYRHAIHVRPDPDFHTDATRLIRGIEKGIEELRKRPAPKPDKPPGKPPIRTLVALAFLGLAILFGVIYVATDKGQIKIEVNDPKAVVTLKGENVRIDGIGEPITLWAGEHELKIKWGDGEFETRKFTVRRGENPVLELNFEPKPQPPSDPTPPAVAKTDPPPTVESKPDPKKTDPPVDIPKKPVEMPRPVVETTSPVDDTLITNTIDMKLKLIPAGEFYRGAADGEPEASDYEKPQRKIRITRPFYLGVYEVTQAEYKAVIGSNPSFFKSTGGGKDKVAGMDTDRFPVEEVSWLDAIAFCNKLSEREGLKPCYTAAGEVIAAGTGYRLPTEAEWEYACRGLTEATTPKTTPFSFGATITPNDANFDGNYTYNGSANGKDLERTARVGSYRPNDFGLFDMHGNVYEWCQDWYDEGYYAKAPEADPQNLTQAALRVIRGGYWDSRFRMFCRSAYRSGGSPVSRTNSLGFRLARVRSVK